MATRRLCGDVGLGVVETVAAQQDKRKKDRGMEGTLGPRMRLFVSRDSRIS